MVGACSHDADDAMRQRPRRDFVKRKVLCGVPVVKEVLFDVYYVGELVLDFKDALSVTSSPM